MGMKPEKIGKREGKKTYGAPRLVTYGNLQRLTMAKGGGSSDNPLAGKTKVSNSPP